MIKKARFKKKELYVPKGQWGLMRIESAKISKLGGKLAKIKTVIETC